jgi:hypothetical protein
MMRFRNTCPAFDVDGEFTVKNEGPKLRIVRSAGNTSAELDADFAEHTFTIREKGNIIISV